MDINGYLNHERINHGVHPLYPLHIFNYDKLTGFEKAWDEYTLTARGLILAEDGTVVARPFGKFFNLGEGDLTVDRLPNSKPDVYEKLDGSMGIMFVYDGKIQVATRGSFVSEQAIWATNWAREHIDVDMLLEGFTYLFEIIYPENRVVIDYKGRSELVLLGIVSNEFGGDVSRPLVENTAKILGVSIARKFDFDDMDTLLATARGLPTNEEGYVLHWPSHNLRVKVKGEEYVAMHRARSGMSNRWVWERMLAGEPLINADVPEEFYDYINRVAAELQAKVDTQVAYVMSAFNKVPQGVSRKEQALYIIKNHPDIKGLLFILLDNGLIVKEVLKGVEPKFEKMTV